MVSSNEYVPEPNCSEFNTGEKFLLLYTNPSFIINTIMKYENFEKSKDNFIIGYTHNSENFNQFMYECFNIKASNGFICRKCPECGIINKLDGKTWDNYANYCQFRKEFKKKAVFAVRFWFDCKHPIAPNKDYIVPKDKKITNTTPPRM